MDPLSALSLAACIVQFIDFGLGLVSNAYEIGKSATGTTKRNEDLEETSTTLSALINGLKYLPDDITQSHNRVPEEFILETVAAKCRATANELQGTLQALRSQDAGSSVSSSLRQAFKLACSKKKLADLESKLIMCRSELSTCLTVIIRYGSSSRLITSNCPFWILLEFHPMLVRSKGKSRHVGRTTFC